MRQILFLAHQLEIVKPVRHNAHSFDLGDATVERYEDVRTVLCAYGQVMREKTSGTFRRISTPPQGTLRPAPATRHRVLAEDPNDHASTVEASARRRKDVLAIRQAFLDAIERSDAVVAMAEFESDTRGALIEHAIGRNKPVLLLHRECGIAPALYPMYLYRDGVDYVGYRDHKELETVVSRFFQHASLRAVR